MKKNSVCFHDLPSTLRKPKSLSLLPQMETPNYDIIKVLAAYDQSSYVVACPPNISVPCSAQVAFLGVQQLESVSLTFWSQGLCHIDGTCACDDGLRGRECSISCAGGRRNPCSGNGDRDLAQ